MNKKIIVLIVVLLIIILGLAIYFISQSNTNNEETINNQITSNQSEIANNNSINSNNEGNSYSNKEILNGTNMVDSNNETESNANILIVYYSRSGNTDKVAKYIQSQVGGDIIRLETVKTYPSDYDEMLDVAQEEQRNGELPELRNQINNIENYDTIFLGYPIWWGNIASPVLTFLNEYDLSNKQIVPFVTSGSSGLSGTPNDIQELEPQATILDALSLTSSNLNNYESLTDNWLQSIGY